MLFAGKPHEPKNLEVKLETAISISVRWKAGFSGGFGPQTFKLEYRKSADTGTWGYFLSSVRDKTVLIGSYSN